MAFGSTTLFDNHFNIAHFLKNIAYGCIFFGILIDLVNTVPRQKMRPKVRQKQPITDKFDRSEQSPSMLEIGRAKRPLSVQLPIAALVLSLVVASVVGFTFYSETTRIAVETNKRYLIEKNRQTQTVISALYKEHFDHLTLISQMPQLQRIATSLQQNPQADIAVDRLDFEKQINNILQKRRIYTGFKYIQLNTQQQIINAVQIDNEVKLVAKRDLKNYQTMPFFEQMENLAPGKMMFSSIKSWQSIHSEDDEPLRYDLAIPVYQHVTDKLLGLAILQINFNRLMQIIDSLALKDVDLYMANNQGFIIYASDRSKTSSQKVANGHPLLKQFPELAEIKTNKYGLALVDTERAELTNHPVHSLYQVYRNSQFGQGHLFKWIIRPSEDQLVDALEQIRNRSFLLSLGLAFLSLSISFLAARKITAPLSKMIKSIKGFEENIELNDLPVEAKDETGVLARSFHNMQLLKNLKDLEVEAHQFALDQHAIVSATNLEGEIIFVNSKFEEITGYSEKELIGKNHRIINSGVHDSNFFKRMYDEILQGKVWHSETCNIAKNGKIFWVDATIVPLLNEANQPYQFIAIRTDISEKKKWEQQLVKEKDKAENAVHAKSEFFASMSHEIRTPMNGVLGMLGLMMRTDLNKQQKHYATLARSSADSLLVIINDILDLSKIEAGKIELEILDFNLREQLGTFAEAMAYRAQDKGLEMVLDVTGIEQSMVKGDPSRLRQILSNLVGNAIKFTEAGEISIKALLKKQDEHVWIFHCEVADTGMGIPSDKVDDLFDSYSQVDSSTTRQFGGTGLGLAIVQQLCTLMDGSVQVKSQIGKGSQFIFDIRLGVSQLSRLVVPQQDIKGKRILIVDDNPTNLEVLVGQLEHWGASTLSAKNGKQALEILKQEHVKNVNHFDIAILDMGMPDMDGAELGKLIRQNKNYDSVKLVMMTSMAGSGDIIKFKHIGFSAYFPKPATTSDLFHALQVLVEDGSTLALLDGMVTNYNISQMTSTNLFSNAYVLLVEDNPINQEVAIGILTDMGITVDLAENGLQAIEKLKDHQKEYGLVIMDCQMPEMDGYEASREIRSQKHDVKNFEIPIIAMTANALKGDRQKCLEAGMDDYLTKPVDPNELEEKLRNWLPEQQQEHHLLPCKESEVKINAAKGSGVKEKNSLKDEVKQYEVKQYEVRQDEKNQCNDTTWNRASLMARVRNNETLVIKLCQLFFDDLPGLVENLQAAVNDGDIDEIVALAHKIKGSAANLSAEALAKTASSIEAQGREGQLDVLKEQMRVFSKQASELLALLEKQLE